MSGSIRTSLGGSRKRADDYLKKYKKLLDDNPIPWTDPIKVEFTIIDTRLQRELTSLQGGFAKWTELIDKINDNDDRETEKSLFDLWYDNPQYSDLIDKLDETVLRIEGYLKINLTTQNNGNGQNIAVCQGVNVLPKISTLELPKYSGDPLKWGAFWQRFKYSVHDKNYPAVEKLNALDSLLKGRAHEEIEGFELSEENYDTVVQILQERFGDKTLLIKQLQSKLRLLPQANPNAESIRTTVNAITNMCRQLQNFGVGIDNESMKLDIIEKMPKREKDKLVVLTVLKKETNIDDILAKMKEMALISEIISENDSHLKDKKVDPKHGNTNTKQGVNYAKHEMNKPKQMNHHNNSFTPNKGGTQFGNKNAACTFCEGNHWAVSCPTFNTVEERQRQLKVKQY